MILKEKMLRLSYKKIYLKYSATVKKIGTNLQCENYYATSCIIIQKI